MEEVATGTAELERGQRHLLKYTFFKVARDWRFLDRQARAAAKDQFLEVVGRHSRTLEIKFYSLIGTRGDADFLIWVIAEAVEDIQAFLSAILRTDLGRYLETPYSYLAMSKKSTYLGAHKHEGQEGDRDERSFGNGKFLFVYPFIKKREWYSIPYKERQRMMAKHFMIGHKYPGIKINTGYSFGLDDQEFVLAFEGESPAEFLDLVEELRSSEVSAYTQLETPIFTCLVTNPKDLLEHLV